MKKIRQKKPKEKSALSQKAYELIIDRILNKSLFPGQIINRLSIANEIGISIAPVLEAMVRLQSEGLLITIPRKGSQIKIIKPSEIVGYLIVREAIECQAARLYCGEILTKNAPALKKFIYDADHQRKNEVDAWKSEIQLHRALVQLTNCHSLLNVFEQTMRLGTLCMANVFMEMHQFHPVMSHADLIQQLKSLDPDDAEKVMSDHLRSGKANLFEQRIDSWLNVTSGEPR